ncbi:MAG TPA: HAD family hydrolase [Acidimicrobiales bacterium]|jgi:putative hydrolase of the HAD superfamily|nr:HAD family hydrolase [Acidimicrobiales bacterium]
MVRAVIFDFYGTLARFADTDVSNYETVFAAHGYKPERAILDSYFSRYDGVEHGEHSVNEEAYESWVRRRLRDLTDACGVPDVQAEDLIDVLRASDQGAMVAYPESAATLSSLRSAGLAIGVCSNWGWELDAYLDQVGLLGLVDAGVTSARAGARKPHADIYDASVGALGVAASEVVFVGDSWEPDVRGPRRHGMTAVHVWRAEERSGMTPPALEAGDHRVGDLTGVLDVVRELRVAGSGVPGPAGDESFGSRVRP